MFLQGADMAGRPNSDNSSVTTFGLHSVLPWVDRAGKFSLFRLVVFAAVIAPALWLGWEAWHNLLGPRPFTEAIHQAGLAAVRLLAATLAITPLRYATRLNKLVSVRRMLGVAVFAYALLHFTLYICDQHGDLLRVGSEIALRIYLTIGFVTLCSLAALAATSTDAAIQRLGSENWNSLHKIVYAIAVLGTVHFFIQSKLEVTEAIIMGGIFALLLGERLARRFWRDLTALHLLSLAAAAALATACFEAAYYMFKTGAPWLMILSVNLDFSYVVRPAWYVFAIGLLLVAARLLRGRLNVAQAPRQRAPQIQAAPAR